MKSAVDPSLKKDLFSKTVTVKKIDAKMRKRMFSLLERYYDDVEFSRFEKDLAEKTHVLLFFERKTRELVGFSTVYRKRIEDVAPGIFIFSGDTVLREDCWGSKILQRSFSKYIIRTKTLAPHRKVYWMLISKGFKTYMMMRLNFKQSYPNVKRKTPRQYQEILDNYYHRKFGNAYDSPSGLITFPSSLGSVKGSFADPSPEQMKNPDIRYFLDRNTNYKDGVELACIAEIRLRDFAGIASKFFLNLGKPSPKKSKR